MSFKKLAFSSAFALAASLMIAQSASAASASYSTQAVAPSIYYKNDWQSVAYPVLGSPPSNAKVTQVSYTWSYTYPRPTGLLVYLCNNIGTVCWNVTNYASGTVNFTGYDVPANQSLRLYAKVEGTGTMAPLYGGTTTVSVNYTY
ncbi:hypothetical protein ABIE61_003308 [Marinobacterium sp. MBR-111]|jgi:hypothetical protein|uniref:flagellar protein FlhE n=1 Tax=Marinobacterium sp. MBR-111 TaxID=3156463 RepID=UPI003390B52C